MLMVMSVVLYITNGLYRALQPLHNITRVNTLPHLDGTQKTMSIKGCNQESEKVEGQVNNVWDGNDPKPDISKK